MPHKTRHTHNIQNSLSLLPHIYYTDSISNILHSYWGNIGIISNPNPHFYNNFHISYGLGLGLKVRSNLPVHITIDLSHTLHFYTNIFEGVL